MSDPTFLNQARGAVAKAEGSMRELELQKAKADSQVEEFAGRLRSLGFDPEADIEAQIDTMEADVKQVLEEVNARIADLHASLV